MPPSRRENKIKYEETLVTRQFRDTIIHHYPFLIKFKKQPLFRLLDHILFGLHVDKDTTNLMLSRDILFSMRNGTSYKTKNFSAKRLLSKFSEDVFNIEYDRYGVGKVRRLSKADIPTWLIEAFNKEICKSDSTDLVYLVSGKQVNINEHLSCLESDAKSYYIHAKDISVLEVLDYLNGLNPKHFSVVKNNWNNAYNTALRLNNPLAKWHQLIILRRIWTQSKPFYKPVEHSSRLYSSNASFLGLKSSVREELTMSWAKVDLKSAQLYIISKLWGIDGIRNYIENCTSSFWTDLAEHMQLPKLTQYKPALKEALYSIVFGAQKRTVRIQLNQTFSNQTSELFFSHPVISSLLKARDAQLDSILLGGEKTDAFGNTLSIDLKATKTLRAKQARSVLAQQAQSYELPVLAPIIEYAKLTEDSEYPLIVTGWLHDGLWLHCEDESALHKHLVKVKELVEEASQNLLGFTMKLDIEMPRSSDIVTAA